MVITLNARNSFYEINLEKNKPNFRDAMQNAKTYLKMYRNSVRCLIFIHGYGSHERGGVIRKGVRSWLSAQQKMGIIKSVIPGEVFDIFHSEAIFLKNRCPELKKYINQNNLGITIVEY